MSVHLLASSSSSSNICTASAPFLPSEPTRSPGCCVLPPPPLPSVPWDKQQRPSPWAQVIKSPGETVGLLQLLPVLCKQMIIES